MEGLSVWYTADQRRAHHWQQWFCREDTGHWRGNYDRRMRLKACGIDLNVVIDLVCADLGVDPADLSNPFSQQKICQARFLLSCLALRDLRISGADAARQMNNDRSSVSRAVGRVQADPALKNMKTALLDHLPPED